MIVSQERVKVDGKVRREELFPVGLMDVVSIPDVKKNYRVLPSEKGLTLHPIEKDEATFKLCRIENKSTTKGGHAQLNLHDGTNIHITIKDPKKPEVSYHTSDVLKLGVPNREPLSHIKLNVKNPAIIIGGKNVGQYGRITDIEKRPSQKRKELLVTIEDKNGNKFQTILDYVFVVGDTEPFISLPEAD